jgi:hypothetical protein
MGIAADFAIAKLEPSGKRVAIGAADNRRPYRDDRLWT